MLSITLGSTFPQSQTNRQVQSHIQLGYVCALLYRGESSATVFPAMVRHIAFLFNV